jgi:ribosomal protein S18 acetylase RimI-like enzyme
MDAGIMDEAGLIRRVAPWDLNKIIDIEQKCFTGELAYTPRQLDYLISRAHSTCLAEICDDVVRGFIIILYKKNSAVAGIETLSVDPEFQGKGIGRRLLHAAEVEMPLHGIRRIRLEVALGNTIALSLYEKSGFRKAALLRDYYDYDHFGSRDAFRMVKELTT